MDSRKKKRSEWRLFINLPLQGALCLRVVCYWFLCQITLLGTVLLFYFLVNGVDGSSSIIPVAFSAFVVSLIFLPVAIIDIIKLSKHIAGPMLNLKNKLKQLNESDSDSAAPLKFRDGDYFEDVRLAFLEYQNQSNANAAEGQICDDAKETAELCAE